MIRSVIRIILPALLTFALFIFAIFAILLPALEQAILARKQEMIQELGHSAWNILANYEEDVQNGLLTPQQARTEAIRQMRDLHYGEENKDYFWVNDLTPRMIAHPYRTDLEGRDLGDFEDPTGKRPFMEMVKLVKTQDEGFVRYQWQDRDNPDQIVSKISFVKLFEPWGWVVGTGIYVDDVESEVQQLTRRLGLISLGILALTGGLLAVMAVQSLHAERQQQEARRELRESELRYRTLVESAGGSIFMALEGDRLYANASALAMLGYSADEIAGKSFDDIIEWTEEETEAGQTHRQQLLAGEAVPTRQEVRLKRKDGGTTDASLVYSVITMNDRRGLIAVATDISDHKAAEAKANRDEEALRRQVTEIRNQEQARKRQIRRLEETISRLQSTDPEAVFEHHLQELAIAASPDEVATCCQRFRGLLAALTQCGLRPDLLGALVSRNTDAACCRLIELALAELDQPPADFALIVMGSQARQEQTLCTDQDNAIVFADVEADRLKDVRAAFCALGETVSAGLEKAGFKRCEGGLMACNAEWVMSLSEWQARFRHWITTLEADDLMHSKIFFDFRTAYGPAHYVDELKASVNRDLASHPRFFTQLARNMLFHEPPIGIFGNLRLSSTAGKSRGIDIKEAMVPLVDYARLYALKHGLAVVGTVQRLDELGALGHLKSDTVAEAIDVYNALMGIRLRHQIRQEQAGKMADNWIEPALLTSIEKRVVKASLAQVRTMQTSMSYDFLGQAGGRQ